MSEPTDGGPAFPVEFWQLPQNELAKGMSLRDYFAAAALQGMLANMGPITDQKTGQVFQRTPEIATMLSYQYADAMVKEREK